MSRKMSLILTVLMLILMFTPCMYAGNINTRDAVVSTYMSQLHVRELTGNNDGAAVESYLHSADMQKGAAWCAAFVNWVFENNNVSIPRSPAWSPSWFPKDKLIDKKYAKPGDVMGIYFKNKKRIAHVGFIHSWNNSRNFCITVEGNTNTEGSREGDGVYKKRRLKRQIYRVANWIDKEGSV